MTTSPRAAQEAVRRLDPVNEVKHVQARLVVTAGPVPGRWGPFTLSPDAIRITIGRTDDNPICLPGDLVSRRHCSVACHDGVWYARDMESSNGTFVNDKRITKYQLGPHDRIRFGKSSFRIVFP